MTLWKITKVNIEEGDQRAVVDFQLGNGKEGQAAVLVGNSDVKHCFFFEEECDIEDLEMATAIYLWG